MSVRPDHRQFDMFAALEQPPAARPMHVTRWEALAVATCGETSADRIEQSYSASALASSGKVVRPFRFRGGNWVVTGAGYFRGDADYECFRIVAASEFAGPGEARTYHDHALLGDQRERLGGYHGMAAKHGGADIVLVGPPVVFVRKAGDA